MLHTDNRDTSLITGHFLLFYPPFYNNCQSTLPYGGKLLLKLKNFFMFHKILSVKLAVCYTMHRCAPQFIKISPMHYTVHRAVCISSIVVSLLQLDFAHVRGLPVTGTLKQVRVNNVGDLAVFWWKKKSTHLRTTHNIILFAINR